MELDPFEYAFLYGLEKNAEAAKPSFTDKIKRHFGMTRPATDTAEGGYHGAKYLSGLGGAAAGALGAHLISKYRRKKRRG